MRFLAPLSLTLRATALLSVLSGPAPAEENSSVSPRQDAMREWQELEKGREEFEVSDLALLPKSLVIAVEQSNCNYKQDMKAAPVRFIVFNYRRGAIVTCWGFVARDQLYDLSDLTRPKLIEFPILAIEGGFTTSSGPGALTWKKEAEIFEVESYSNARCTGRGRHTYRMSRARLAPVLIRIELNEDDCGKNEWTTIWKAPESHELTSPTGRQP